MALEKDVHSEYSETVLVFLVLLNIIVEPVDKVVDMYIVFNTVLKIFEFAQAGDATPDMQYVLT